VHVMRAVSVSLENLPLSFAPSLPPSTPSAQEEGACTWPCIAETRVHVVDLAFIRTVAGSERTRAFACQSRRIGAQTALSARSLTERALFFLHVGCNEPPERVDPLGVNRGRDCLNVAAILRVPFRESEGRGTLRIDDDGEAY